MDELTNKCEDVFDEDIIMNVIVDKMNNVLTNYGITIHKGYKTSDKGMTEKHWVVPDPTITKK